MNEQIFSISSGEEPGFTESGLVHISAATKDGVSVNRDKYVDGYDESLRGVHAIAPDRYHAVWNTLKNVNTELKKQDIHDLYCPTCNFYFIKRVNLPRKAISTGEVSVPMPEFVPDNQEPGFSRVDVIKAIVYGGLLESIASLCIIVSAAGGDASTLNIVALGLANVFGGLLVLANNLTTLKELTGQQYIDQLGQPKHFLIQATVAVLSYLVFGLISPFIYGFSFYASDNKYLKLASMAAGSFVCITLLSVGKAYAQRPPKAYLQTILYYVGLAVAVSGIAYIAGDLISILLNKFCVFEPGNSVSMPVLDATAAKGMSSSY